MTAVHAVVLIQCDIDEISEAAQAIAEIDGVSEVYSVAGEFDLIAIVRVTAHEQLADVIPGGIAKVGGVARTETLISFRVFSRHDLDRLFSLGFEGRGAEPQISDV
jgi:DNA-binding Lrp family transcriptional regulator